MPMQNTNHHPSHYWSHHHQVAAFITEVPGRISRKLGATRATPKDEADCVIIGSGIGGLCTAALLSHYGKRVIVVESHDRVGGVAHAFNRDGYTIDVGPSFWSGMSSPSTNPLRQLMDVVDAQVEWVRYNGWGCHELESGYSFRMTAGLGGFDQVAAKHGVLDEWQNFLRGIEPIVDASMACPPMALRRDPFGFARFSLPRLLPSSFLASIQAKAWVPSLLTGKASDLLYLGDSKQKKPSKFLTGWIDYLSFAISAKPASGTLGAPVAYSIGDLHIRDSPQPLDYPLGGSAAVAKALQRSIEANGGQVRLRSHVDQILLSPQGRATGVRLKDDQEISATELVVSNADIWSTYNLLGFDMPQVAEPTPSFLHLWVGFDKTGLPSDLDGHHSVLNTGSFFGTNNISIDARGNMHIISIATVFDPSLAPSGKHLAHVYAAANEPFEDWFPRPDDYQTRKEKALEPLWKALEAVIPDVRQRAEFVIGGTPLTHAFWNRRYRGSYGPTSFADGGTSVPNVFTVGDSNFPGIGLPAAAASAILVANSCIDFDHHAAQLADMQMSGTLCAGRDWWSSSKNPQRKNSQIIDGGTIRCGSVK